MLVLTFSFSLFFFQNTGFMVSQMRYIVAARVGHAGRHFIMKKTNEIHIAWRSWVGPMGGGYDIPLGIIRYLRVAGKCFNSMMNQLLLIFSTPHIFTEYIPAYSPDPLNLPYLDLFVLEFCVRNRPCAFCPNLAEGVAANFPPFLWDFLYKVVVETARARPSLILRNSLYHANAIRLASVPCLS